MSEQNGWLDVAKLIAETQTTITLPIRGDKLTVRKVHQAEINALVQSGRLEEYEGQHAFSARIVSLAAVRPRLTVEEALSLGPDAPEAAVAVLRFSGLTKDAPEPTGASTEAPVA